MEDIMQYLWQNRLYGSPDKQLKDGRRVRILHPGLQNNAAGPDFFNAKIIIDGLEWVGNIELHLRASDWYRHGHQNDPAYDNIILHVVGQDDADIPRSDGTIIPQLTIPFDRETAARYSLLKQHGQPMRCARYLPGVPSLFKRDWIEGAAHERLLEKSDRILQTLQQNGGDWNQAVLICIARGLGFGSNSIPFELLGKSIPLNVAGHHTDSQPQLEALLFGQAGMLDPTRTIDPYYRYLTDEYAFLASKYRLRPLPSHIWQRGRIRPGGQAPRRIALLATLLREGTTLLSRILEIRDDINALRDLFRPRLPWYWTNRLDFGQFTATTVQTAISPQMASTLLINTAAPIFHAYGIATYEPAYGQLALWLLHNLPAESNYITQQWQRAAGITPLDAFESQGLIQITKAYCQPGNCLRCRIAHRCLRVQ